MKIERYRFGEMVIDGQTYHRDLILLPDKVIQNWRRREGHRLILDDIGMIPLSHIECLIIGTGKFGMMKVDEQVCHKMTDIGIECFVEITDKAVKMFDSVANTKKVAAAFHLTC